MQIDTALLTYLADELGPYKDDLDTFWDTMDGETGIIDVVGKIIEGLVEADANEDAVNAIIARYNGRKSAIQGRRDSLKRALKRVMLATGQPTIPHPIATVSLRKGTTSVVIEDEKEIPSQLCKVTVTPDKTEIKKQLKSGVEIDGARLVTGPQTVNIRMK